MSVFVFKVIEASLMLSAASSEQTCNIFLSCCGVRFTDTDHIIRFISKCNHGVSGVSHCTIKFLSKVQAGSALSLIW